MGELLDWAARAAGLLYERGAQRVWVWGSLGEGLTLDSHSDIDLAVEGIPEWMVDSVITELRDRSPFKIDIVRMEDTSAQVRWFIRRGRALAREVPFASASNGVRRNLKHHRLRAVHEVLRQTGARRVLDLGCGRGWLVELIAQDPATDHVLGIDKDEDVLAEARARLADRLTPAERGRAQLALGLLTWRDPRFTGFDAAVALEVVEHLPPPHLAAFESALFGHASPPTIVVTTPNVEYNPIFGLDPHEFRLRDHVFEWTRSEFAGWGHRVAERYGYTFHTEPIGPSHTVHGAPTQLGRFLRT